MTKPGGAPDPPPAVARRTPFAAPFAALAAGIAATGVLRDRPASLAVALVVLLAITVHARLDRRWLTSLVLAAVFVLGVVAGTRMDSTPSPSPADDAPILERIDETMSWRLSRFARSALMDDRPALDDRDRVSFRRAGVTHLLAISGLHVALIGGLAWGLFAAALGPRPLADVAAAVVTITYVAGVGAPASALRSGLMVAALLAGRAMGRPADALNTLFGAAFVTVLFDPPALFDVGFQLSYAAAYGLIAWTRPLEFLLRFLPGPVRGLFAASLAAQAMTTPLMVWHFREFAPIAFLANIPSIPIFSLLLTLVVAALAGVPAAATAGDALLGVFLEMIEVFALLPGASFLVDRIPLEALAAVGGFAAVPFVPGLRRRATLSVLLGVVMVASLALHRPTDGVLVVMEAPRKLGVLVVENGEGVILDDGLSLAAWRDAITRRGCRSVTSFRTISPAALGPYAGRGLGAWCRVDEWIVPGRWMDDPEKRRVIDSIESQGTVVRTHARPCVSAAAKGETLLLGDVNGSPEGLLLVPTGPGTFRVERRGAAD